jgi:hypothetical protein
MAILAIVAIMAIAKPPTPICPEIHFACRKRNAYYNLRRGAAGFAEADRRNAAAAAVVFSLNACTTEVRGLSGTRHRIILG